MHSCLNCIAYLLSDLRMIWIVGGCRNSAGKVARVATELLRKEKTLQ